jgi:hypothetical protein
MTDIVGEQEFAGLVASFQVRPELLFEKSGHNLYGNEEPFSRRDPATSVRREPAARNNTVNMGMVHKILSPGVQYAHEADTCAEMFRVVCQFKKGLRNRTEEDTIHDFLIAEDKRLQFCGEGEDDMKVLYGKKIFRSRLDPFLFSEELAFGAVTVSAGVVKDLYVVASVTLVFVSAKGGGPAVLNGTHNPPMLTGHLMRSSVLRAVLTEDIRHLGAARCMHSGFLNAVSAYRGDWLPARGSAD